MRTWIWAALLLVAAGAALWFGGRPYALVERALDAVPPPNGGVVTEEIRRRTDDCGALVCPQRIRVYTVNGSGSELCETYAHVVPASARVLSFDGVGSARCGWVFDHGDVTVGVIVEEPPGITELVVSARLTGQGGGGSS